MASEEIKLVGSFKDDITPKLQKLNKEIANIGRSFERFNKKRNLVSILLFFSFGIYGGFIQAGVGFIIMAALTGIHGLNLAKTNSVKVFVVLCYTSVALLVFMYNGKVLWTYGFILAVGNAIGAWVASRWSVGVNEKWIRLILILTLSALAIKLWLTSVSYAN